MTGDGKPEETPPSDWPSGLALRCLESARAIVSRATNTSLLWSLALAFVWLAGLEPKARALDELKARKRAFADLQVRQSFQRSSSAVLRRVPDRGDDALAKREVPNTLESAGHPDSSQVSNKTAAPSVPSPSSDPDVDSTAKSKRDQLGASQDSIARLKELANVSFQLPGVNGAIQTVYAPLLWSILLLGLISYLYRSRVEVLRLVVAALGSSTKAPEEASTNLLGHAPLWLAPIPSTNADHPDRKDVERAIGWSLPREHSKLLALAVLCTTWLLQIRVVWLGFVVAESLGSDTFDSVVVPSLLVVVAVMTLGATIEWLRTELPGSSTVDASAARVTRRRLVAKAAMAAAAVTLFPVYRFLRASGRLPGAKPSGGWQPRLKRITRYAFVQLTPGTWVRNTRSHAVHYVVPAPAGLRPSEQQGFASHCGGRADGASAILGVSFVSEGNLEAIPSPALSSKADDYPNLATVSRSFESAALDVLQANTKNGRIAKEKLDEVFGLLRHGIQLDTVRAGRAGRAPSYRLYDLAAGLAVRYGQRGVIASLEQDVRSGRYARPGYGAALSSRVQKWKTSTEWEKKWRAPDQKWGCVALPVM